jgi:PAS domain S-box-containing protein
MIGELGSESKNWMRRLAGRGRKVWHHARNPRMGALLPALVALAVLLPGWRQASRWYEARLLTEQRAQVMVETSLYGNALSSAVSRRMAKLQGLYAFVQADMQDEQFESHFETFAAALYANSMGIRNLALAPGGAVRYVYPVAGNERLLGYEPLADPRPGVSADARRAIESGEVVISGPNELVQGGLGLIARQAVYQDGRFWGLVNIVVDVPPLLEEAGFDPPASGLDFALQSLGGKVFYGSPAIFESEPVVVGVGLPEGGWELAGVPEGGWHSAIRGSLLVFQAGGLVIVGLLTSLTYLAVNRQARLARAVRQRTSEITRINQEMERDIAERQRIEQELRKNEEQYRGIFEASTDALFINDLDGRLVDFNPAAARMHGYSVEEFRQLQPAQFIHPDSLHLFADYIETVKAGGQFRSRAVDVCKDGTPFHVEVFGTAFTYRGQPHTLGVVRDITEQVQAEQVLEQRVETRARELATLLRISHEVASTLALEPLLGLILDQLKDVVDYAGASILGLDGGGLKILAYRGPVPEAEALKFRFPLEQTGTNLAVIQAKEAVIVPDAWADTPLARAFQGTLGDQVKTTFGYIRSWLGVPLVAREQVIGMLAVEHTEAGAFSSRHAELVRAFANQVAVAIENARLYEQAQGKAALEERHRLARELHDSVTQMLYSLTLFAEAGRQQAGKGDLERVERHLARIGETAQQALKEMRILVYELRPPVLEQEGLVGALRQRLEAVEQRAGVEARLVVDDLVELAGPVEEGLYRIAQEALNNALKHAGATSVIVQIGTHNGRAVLEVTDNGRGFDPGRAGEQGGMGLMSMRERVEKLGGSLSIRSAPGQGTRVRVEAELTRPAPDGAGGRGHVSSQEQEVSL